VCFEAEEVTLWALRSRMRNTPAESGGEILEVNVKDSMKLFLRMEIGLKEVAARIKARLYFNRHVLPVIS
jgi:hypothetical protein